MDNFSINELNEAEKLVIPWGEPVNSFGKISDPDGRWLKSLPLPEVRAEIVHLPFGENIYINRKYLDPKQNPNSKNKIYWYHVTTHDAWIGWVSGGVSILPAILDFDTKLYLVKKGDSLWEIVHQFYGTKGTKGNDTRFYVGAVAYVNRLADGIVIPKSLDFKDDEAWESLSKIRVGTALWLPRDNILQQLKEQVVSTGSWYFDKVYRIVRLVRKAYDWAVEGLGIIAGMIKGALLSVYDIFEDAVNLLKTVISVIYKIITGALSSALKKLYLSIVKFISTLPEVAKSLKDQFSSQWNNESAWERGKFRGTVVGYLLGTVIIAYLTLGASALVQVMGKSTRFAKLAEKLAKYIEKIPELTKAVEGLSDLKFAHVGEARKFISNKVKPDFPKPRPLLANPLETKLGQNGKGDTGIGKDSRGVGKDSRGNNVDQSSVPNTKDKNIFSIDSYTTPAIFRKKLAEYFKVNEAHPLIAIFDKQTGKLRPSTKKGMDMFYWHEHPEVIQAGHVTSRHSGAPDKIVIMTAYQNQMLNNTVEMGKRGWIDGGFKVAIIDGIPISVESAKHMIAFEKLSQTALDNAVIKNVNDL